MPPLAYTVAVTLPDESMAADWLRTGHIADVLAGGAVQAAIVALDAAAHSYEVRYLFPSREAFDRYEREHAPRLRAEGLKLFPVDKGVVYRRSVGVVLEEFPAGR